MKTFILVLSVFTLMSSVSNAQSKKVYDALSSKNLTTIEQQIKQLTDSKETSNQAYEGTLLMKKAGLIKGPGKKLKTFKEGRLKLEKAIEDDKDNGEYRFLRLMIQENAPDILGYNKDIKEDAAVIQQKYSSLKPEVKNAIQSYSTESKTLKTLSLK